jgi:hypothetical protein
VTIQITEISTQAVKRHSPFDSARGERRQTFLQEIMSRNQKLPDCRRVSFLNVFQNRH